METHTDFNNIMDIAERMKPIMSAWDGKDAGRIEDRATMAEEIRTKAIELADLILQLHEL